MEIRRELVLIYNDFFNFAAIGTVYGIALGITANAAEATDSKIIKYSTPMFLTFRSGFLTSGNISMEDIIVPLSSILVTEATTAYYRFAQDLWRDYPQPSASETALHVVVLGTVSGALAGSVLFGITGAIARFIDRRNLL